MRPQIILVDWENVQPDLLPALALEDVRVLVFVGPNQTKLPFALADVKAIFAGRLDDAEIEPAIELLRKGGACSIDGQKVRYPAQLEAVHAA